MLLIMYQMDVLLLFLLMFISSCRGHTRYEDFYRIERSIERRVDNAKWKEPPLATEWVVNVENHGAIGDGVTDNKEAFAKAWSKACSLSALKVVLLVPENKEYLLKPLVFSGSCESDITVLIKGTLVASCNRSHWDGRDSRHWILFEGVRNLVVKGGGTIKGNGQIWWQNSCKINKTLPCTGAPTAMTFYSCKDLKVEDLMFKDSQQVHVSFEKCTNVAVSKLFISAPEKSPNTDGIHVAHTENMVITDCVISTGDDCISIVSGSRNVKGMNIVCGPGHGISIGSLGANNTKATVRNVMMDGVRLSDTTNGVRIKSWQTNIRHQDYIPLGSETLYFGKGGRGYAKGIIFKNIAMHNVKNPIIIDQNYCDSPHPCPEQDHAVRISGVMYKNIRGSSASEVAVSLNCSRTFPCRRIVLQDVVLVREDGEQTQSVCNHVGWTESGQIMPPLCAEV